MIPHKKAYLLLTISVLILSLVVSVIVFTSKKQLNVNEPKAATVATVPTVIPSMPTPSITPQVTKERNQDVPLKILGSTASGNQREHSYLYTELATKGIISNVTSNSVSILWLTEAPQQTLLKYGISENKLTRYSTNAVQTYIHEAKIEKLTANTLYYYTGHAPIIDSFTTPTSLANPSLIGKKISGTVTDGSGTCLVRLAFSRGEYNSAYLTTTTTNNTWTFTLDKLRTADYNNYYIPENADTAEIDVLCINSGKSLLSGRKRTTFSIIQNNNTSIRVYAEN